MKNEATDNTRVPLNLAKCHPHDVQNALMLFHNEIAMYNSLRRTSRDVAKVLYTDLEERRKEFQKYFGRSLDDIVNDFNLAVTYAYVEMHTENEPHSK